MSLFRASDPDNQHDVLASNLLFITLAMLLGEYLFEWATPGAHSYFKYLPATAPWWRKLALVLLALLLRGGVCYGVRRGVPAIKWLLGVGSVVLICAKTSWQHGYVAGVSFAHFNGSALLTLLHVLLALAALVLMFTKPRPASRRAME